MEYHEKSWDTRQDGESDSRHLHGFECAVDDRSVTSYRLMIKYGVKMGCVMSGFLFLLSWTGS